MVLESSDDLVTAESIPSSAFRITYSKTSITLMSAPARHQPDILSQLLREDYSGCAAEFLYVRMTFQANQLPFLKRHESILRPISSHKMPKTVEFSSNAILRKEIH